MRIDIRQGEAAKPQPYLAWDTAWSGTEGDWAVSGGGLASNDGIATAVLLCLFTDRRCPADHPLAWLIEDGDPRGWWGDSIGIDAGRFESELGSLLWLLERAPLTEDIRRWAESLAVEALQPLIAQKLAVRVDVAAAADPLAGRLDLSVGLFAADGRSIYATRFEDLWKQTVR